MCLDKITNFHIEINLPLNSINEELGFGWKLFRKTRLPWCVITPYTDSLLFKKIWYTAKEPKDRDLGELKYYDKGFHLYLKKEDAESKNKLFYNRYEVKKVAFKGIICSGWQDNRKILVVNKLKVL